MPSASRAPRSSSWSAIEPAAAHEPKSERPKRAPSSSAQLTSRTVSGGSPSSAIRRSTSTPAMTLSAPSSQPPFGTESMWPPISSARSDVAAQREPLVARGVDLLLGAGTGDLPAQPLARPLPGVRPRDALRAVLVAGQLPKLAQLVDGAGWLERHAARLYNCEYRQCGDALRGARRGSCSHSVASAALAARARRALGALGGLPLDLDQRRAGRGRSSSTTRRCRTSTTIVGALFEPDAGIGDVLIVQLLHAALFTAKEAVVGFAIGADGRLRARRRSSRSSRVLQRGLLPYVVASQTIPILAIAPIVVVCLGSLESSAGADDWFRVAVIAAYLTFFPVTDQHAARAQLGRPRARVELMRSYAAGNWTILWKLRVPAALPYLFSALKVSATASVVGAIIGEAPSSIQDGLGG